jgi:hypothetical protein
LFLVSSSHLDLGLPTVFLWMVSIFRTLLYLILMVTNCTDFVFPLYQLQHYSSTMQWTDYNS